jgi:hypothetical protein
MALGIRHADRRAPSIREFGTNLCYERNKLMLSMVY